MAISEKKNQFEEVEVEKILHIILYLCILLTNAEKHRETFVHFFLFLHPTYYIPTFSYGISDNAQLIKQTQGPS